MSEETPSGQQIGRLIIAEQAAQFMLATSRVHLNLGQDIMVTTEDKIWRVLTSHLGRTEHRRGWTTPLGILLAILVVFPTTDFRPFVVSADTWRAFFLFSVVVCIGWLGLSLWRAGDRSSVSAFLKSLVQSKGSAVDDLVAEIKITAISTEMAGAVIAAQESGAIFRDTFEDFEGWRQYQEGTVSQSDEIRPHSGTFCLKKDGASDPHGGFRELGKNIHLGLVLSGWVYRPERRTRGLADRLALENGDFDGYGFVVDHSGNTVWIERRDNGSGVRIEEMVSFTAPVGEWYRFQLDMKTGGRLQLVLYSRSGAELIRTPEVSDEKYTSFDRVVVHGGFPYYVDDLEIARYEA